MKADSGNAGSSSLVRRIAVLAALVLVVAIGYVRCASTALDGQRQRVVATRDSLEHLRVCLTYYLADHPALPGPGIRDVLDALQGQQGTHYYESYLSYREHHPSPDADAWRHALIYERRDATHAVLRSVGQNGVDENGEGDDIQVEIPPW